MTFMRKPVLLRSWFVPGSMCSRALQSKFLHLAGQTEAGLSLPVEFQKCSAPVPAEHICGQSKRIWLWRWNVLPSSHPSWPSIASACYKFLPQGKGTPSRRPQLVWALRKTGTGSDPSRHFWKESSLISLTHPVEMASIREEGQS